MTFDTRRSAMRSGVTPELVERVVELGIIQPGDGELTAGDARRLALMQTLQRAGLPLEGIATAIQRGQLSLGFIDATSYDRFSSLTDKTFRQLSDETGVPLELLLVVREAIGFAVPEADDSVRDVELRIVPLVRLQLELGFRSATIERWLRVYGESLRRVAETEADWWHTEVEMRLMESGMPIAEMLEQSDVHIAQRMEPLLDDVIIALYRGQQEHTWTASIINGVEAALNEAGVFSRLQRPPAICFLDLTGYTQLTEERGDAAAADLADRLGRMVRRSSAQHTGKPIKWLGDGVMFYFREPGQGVLAALEMVEAAQAASLPPAHVGLHAGPVLFQDGDYFGRTVNVAARIGDYARPGEVLVSQSVVDAADEPAVAFREIGEVALKGVAEPVRLHAAHRT